MHLVNSLLEIEDARIIGEVDLQFLACHALDMDAHRGRIQIRCSGSGWGMVNVDLYPQARELST